MNKYMMTFEAFIDENDTKPEITLDTEPFGTFKIGKVSVKNQNSDSIAITIQYQEDKILQILKVHGVHKVIGDKTKTRSAGWRLKQELACYPELEAIMREHGLANIFNYLHVSDFYE
jgi:hypothetical protein